MNDTLRSLFQIAIIKIIRPYIVRELPGWGKIYLMAVGSYKRNWFWAGAPEQVIQGKLHGYRMHLDLEKWADRGAFFLGRWYDLPTQLFLLDHLRQGQTVIDVGANRGMFALLASSLVGNAGRVICFEPNPDCVRLLKREIASNQIANIAVNEFALGEQDERLALVIPKINTGEATLGKSSYPEHAVSKLEVQVRKGDDALQNENPSLIKIDVEGFEPKVIVGLEGTLRRTRPIIMTEIVAKHLANCGSSVPELIALMNGLRYDGFRLNIRREKRRYVWTLAPLEGDAKTGDAVWFHRDAQNRPLHAGKDYGQVAG